MPFNKRTAKQAANKRWKQNAQPDFKTTRNLPTAPESDTIDIAAELPITIDAMAGGMPRWEDLVYDLDPLAYRQMRTCIAINKAVRKLAVRTAKLNWTIVGKGERADALKEIFGQIKNWGDFIEWMTWALIEGVRFYQIKTAPARPGSLQPWNVPDFYMGGRLKKNAGGDMVWDGAEKLVCQQRVSAVSAEEAKKLSEQFAIHRPGGGSNPEGDLWLGAALYNAVGKAHPRGITSGDLYMRLFGIPAIMAGAKMDSARPGALQTQLEARAKKALQALDHQGNAKAVGLSNAETIELLQANPQGLDGIVNWLRYLESIADDTLAFGVLTSSSGIADAGRTGDTQEHGDEGDDAAFANGVQIAETFNRYVMPWILRKNPDLPELAEPPAEAESDALTPEEAVLNAAPFQFKPKGEPKPTMAGTLEPKEPERETEPYLWPKDPTDTDSQDVSVESEGEDPMGGDPTKPVDEKKPADMALIALKQIVQLQRKQLDGTVKLEGDGGWVTINGTPVHIGEDGTIDKGPADMKGKTPDDLDDGDISDDKAKLIDRAAKAEKAAKNAERRVAKYKAALKNWPEGSDRHKAIVGMIEADEKIAEAQRKLAGLHRERAGKL
jgi:hypothetical protein